MASYINTVQVLDGTFLKQPFPECINGWMNGRLGFCGILSNVPSKLRGLCKLCRAAVLKFRTQLGDCNMFTCNKHYALVWSDCSVVKICYADVHLLCSLHKKIRGNVNFKHKNSTPETV